MTTEATRGALGSNDQLGLAPQRAERVRFGPDDGPPPQPMSTEEELHFLRGANAKLTKRCGDLGGLHAHINWCLDDAGITQGPAIHRRVELACLELQQVRLREKALRVRHNSGDEFEA